MVDIQSAAAEIRRGKKERRKEGKKERRKERKKERNHRAKIHRVSKNVPSLACYNFDTHKWILIFFWQKCYR